MELEETRGSFDGGLRRWGGGYWWVHIFLLIVSFCLFAFFSWRGRAGGKKQMWGSFETKPFGVGWMGFRVVLAEHRSGRLSIVSALVLDDLGLGRAWY